MVQYERELGNIWEIKKQRLISTIGEIHPALITTLQVHLVNDVFLFAQTDVILHWLLEIKKMAFPESISSTDDYRKNLTSNLNKIREAVHALKQGLEKKGKSAPENCEAVRTALATMEARLDEIETT